MILSIVSSKASLLKDAQFMHLCLGEYYIAWKLISFFFSFLVIDSLGIQTFLGLLPSTQIFGQKQTTEFLKSCTSRIQICDSNPPPELGDNATEVLQIQLQITK